MCELITTTNLFFSSPILCYKCWSVRQKWKLPLILLCTKTGLAYRNRVLGGKAAALHTFFGAPLPAPCYSRIPIKKKWQHWSLERQNKVKITYNDLVVHRYPYTFFTWTLLCWKKSVYPSVGPNTVSRLLRTKRIIIINNNNNQVVMRIVRFDHFSN